MLIAEIIKVEIIKFLSTLLELKLKAKIVANNI